MPEARDEEVLHGGMANAGAVVRVGDHVLRPASEHAEAIHALLRHVRERGFTGASEVVRLEDDGRERLVFIPGEVSTPPHPDWAQTDEALASVARLLRAFHDATAGFRPPAGADWSGELADPSGEQEVVCHNDACLENVVFRHGRAVALLDFDFAAPGRRVHDLACFARMCVPIEVPEDAARCGFGPVDPFSRLRVVAEAYGLDDTAELVDVLGTQFAQSGDFVRRRVERGERPFIEMWERMGGEAHYERRRRWFDENRHRFLAPGP
jgi:hypothetical protein